MADILVEHYYSTSVVTPVEIQSTTLFQTLTQQFSDLGHIILGYEQNIKKEKYTKCKITKCKSSFACLECKMLLFLSG